MACSQNPWLAFLEICRSKRSGGGKQGVGSLSHSNIPDGLHRKYNILIIFDRDRRCKPSSTSDVSASDLASVLQNMLPLRFAPPKKGKYLRSRRHCHGTPAFKRPSAWSTSKHETKKENKKKKENNNTYIVTFACQTPQLLFQIQLASVLYSSPVLFLPLLDTVNLRTQ